MLILLYVVEVEDEEHLRQRINERFVNLIIKTV